MIIYVILRTTFDIGLYSITQLYKAVVFADTFSLNFNHTSTVPLLTDSFCREQSMVIRVKPFKKEYNWNDGSFLSRDLIIRRMETQYISYKIYESAFVKSRFRSDKIQN